MTAPQVSWSWQVSFGHLVSFAGMLCVAAVAWADIRSSDAQQTRRLEQLEEAAAGAGLRFAASDVMQARADARMERIEELMTEVREELRAINRREP